ncbi:hypothetical protein CLAFUR0_13222 [Fulvia fulva]|nr:hypothetical protein CLAFUR0_13222 [Fulvia fulva]
MAKDKAAKPSSSKKKDASTTNAKPAKSTNAKPAKSTKATSKSSGLSEERIADSDSDNEPAPVPKKTTPKKPTPKSTTKKESTKKSKAVSPPSSESEESSSAEETTKVVPKKPEGVPPKVNGVKRKAEEEESSGKESRSSDEEAEAEKPQAKKAKTTTTKAASPPSSDEEESSAESEAEKSAAAARAATPKDKQPALAQQQQSSLQSIPAKPFEPPSGYSSCDVEIPDSDSHLSKKNLAGKQIWHITAPSNVPIKTITEVALDAVSNGTPVLNYKDVDYVLDEDTSYDTKFSNVLLPGDAGFQHAGQNVDRTLRLQQKIELPNLSKKQADLNTGSNAAADIAQAPVSDIRPQPKGLKMRYKPPGFGKGDPGMMSGSSDDEGQQSSNKGFQFPKTLGAHGAADEPETALTEKSKKKDKKRRKSENLIDGDVEMVNGDSMPPPSSKKKKKKQEDGLERVVSKESERSQEKEDETPEEKARRREQKRLKKEAKKRAKEGESGLEKSF